MASIILCVTWQELSVSPYGWAANWDPTAFATEAGLASDATNAAAEATEVGAYTRPQLELFLTQNTPQTPHNDP